MKRLYAALVSVSFLVGCGKAAENIYTNVEQTPLTAIPVTSLQTEKSSLPPCDGVPDIQKLFQGYKHSKSSLLEMGLTTPSIKRAYEHAEGEMGIAREMLALCRRQSDRAPCTSRPTNMLLVL